MILMGDPTTTSTTPATTTTTPVVSVVPPHPPAPANPSPSLADTEPIEVDESLSPYPEIPIGVEFVPSPWLLEEEEEEDDEMPALGEEQEEEEQPFQGAQDPWASSSQLPSLLSSTATGVRTPTQSTLSSFGVAVHDDDHDDEESTVIPEPDFDLDEEEEARPTRAAVTPTPTPTPPIGGPTTSTLISPRRLEEEETPLRRDPNAEEEEEFAWGQGESTY